MSSLANRTATLVVCALVFASSSFAQKAVPVKLGTLAPRGSSFHQILMTLGQEWKKQGVELTIFTDGTQGSEADMVRRMRLGQLHAGLLTAVGLADIDDSVEALQSMPMMFHSLEEVDWVRARLRDDVEKRLLEKGYVVLFWADAGWVRFFSADPVLRPEDLKKTKLFVTAGDTTSTDLMKAAGYHPIPLSPTDILPGLNTGLINAVPTVPTIALAGQFYGKAPNMLEIDWAPLVGGLVMTKKKWESLSPEARAVVRTSALKAGDQMKAKIRAENDQAVATMVLRGLKVHKPTAAIEAEWRSAAAAVWPKIRGSIVPAKFFDDVQRLLAEYRASSGKGP